MIGKIKQYVIIILLIFSATINIAAVGTLIYHYWQQDKKQDSTCNMMPFRRLLRENLNMADKDISSFKGILAKDKADIIAIRKKIWQEQDRLFDILAGNKINNQEIEQQIEKICHLQASMEKIVIKNFIAIKAELPPEKQEKLIEAIRKRGNIGSRGRKLFGFDQKRRRW